MSVAIRRKPALGRAASWVPGTVSPGDLSARRLELSAQAYRLLVIVILAAYLVLWLAHSRYVYGWLMDDRVVYFKAALARDNPISPFMPSDGRNALHTYFYLISLLPMKLDIRLPSYALPVFLQNTGHFRFFLLYAVLLHGVLLLAWAWFATHLTRNRVAAVLSLLWFATSPTLTFWSPQPDSRVLGMPFALVGMWLLLQAPPFGNQPTWRVIARFAAAGTLFAVAASIHYTSLYLVLPFCACYALLGLPMGWRHLSYWWGLGALVVGLGWLQALYEGISLFVAGKSWAEGPTKYLLTAPDSHVALYGTGAKLAAWADYLGGDVGALLVLATVAGWGWYAVEGWRRQGADGHRRLVVAATVALGMAYLGLSPSMPFLRQTAVLQPFFFLFAALALVAVARRCVASAPAGALALGALVLVLGVVPWQESRAVFQAHQGLGRALEWVARNHGRHPVVLDVVQSGLLLDGAKAWSIEDLPWTDPDAWLVSYFPWHSMAARPSLQAALLAAPPLAA